MKSILKIIPVVTLVFLGGCVILFSSDHNDAKKVDVKVNGVGTISIDNATEDPAAAPTPDPTPTPTESPQSFF